MISMICTCALYEKGKRAKLKESYILSKIEEKKSSQISELLRLFQDGLIIIDQNYNIQYKNDTANRIIKTCCNSITDEFKNMKFQDGRLIFDAIHNIKFNTNNDSISLGVVENNEFLYE